MPDKEKCCRDGKSARLEDALKARRKSGAYLRMGRLKRELRTAQQDRTRLGVPA